MMRVLVLGGNGFIGSNIVNSLKNMAAEVFVGGRNLANKPNDITVKNGKHGQSG